MRHRWLIPLALVTALPPSAVLIGRATDDFRHTVHEHWRWSRGPRTTLARTEVAGAVLRGDAYVIGGFVPPNRTTAVVERYRGGGWRRVRPLPVPLNHAAAIGYRGHVYVLGGYASPNGLTQAVATLYRYDPRDDRWVRLPSMPTARAALAVGASEGRLFAAGGSDGTNALRTFEIYDVGKRRWATGPPLSVAREHLGGAVENGRFYAVAGRSAAAGNMAIVERYDPYSRRWTRMPDVPKARGGNAAARLDELVLAVGGEEQGGTIAEVDAFDTFDRKWRRLADMPTPRHGLAVVGLRGEIWAIEGGASPGFSFSNRVEILRDFVSRD